MNTTPERNSRGIQFEITEENYKRAVTASSASCLVANAIQEQHPKLSSVRVNVATIRFSDRKRGERYLFLTPPSVGELLLGFDQGWPEESLPKSFRLREPLKISPIVRSAKEIKIAAERRAARLTELEAKVQSGQTLTRDENRSLTILRNPKEAPPRPTTYGPAKVEMIGNHEVVYGRPVKHARLDANLLDGRTRHFGAKTAQPSEVFKRAVDDAVKAALKEERAKRRRPSNRE
jgi:hypothetical protein